MNVKAKNYEDLISGKKFNKQKDVLVLNDPMDAEFNKLRDINGFFHIRNQRQLEATKTSHQNNSSRNNNIRHSVTASRILDKLNNSAKKDDKNNKSILKKKREAVEEQQPTQESKKAKIYSEDEIGRASCRERC